MGLLAASRAKRIALSTALAGALLASLWFGAGQDTTTARTLSLYHVRTKESLIVTYKVDGRYVPSALAKIDYLMRDWRHKEVARIDPKTIDLMWKLHTDLGSTRPIHVISGYRSPKADSFLMRSVARKNQHMVGKAIDFYFPDISTEKLRNSAIVRQAGGVGYYRSSGTSDFVHIDLGEVRTWPRVVFNPFRGVPPSTIRKEDQG